MSHESPDANMVREAGRAVANHQGVNSPGMTALSPTEVDVNPELDWDSIHNEIQKVFDGLAARILAQVPSVASRPGSTVTRAFALFSYRIFDRLDGVDGDPVVVGISFSPKNDRIQIEGDISGDESGFVYFDEGCRIEVKCEPNAVMEQAREIAARLAAQDSTILEAIRACSAIAVPR